MQSVHAAGTILEVHQLATLNVSLVPIAFKIKLVTIRNALILAPVLAVVMRNAKSSITVRFVAALLTLRVIRSLDATKKKVRRTEKDSSMIKIHKLSI